MDAGLRRLQVSPTPPEPSGDGWNGGTGTVWTTDPDHGLTGILFSTRAMTWPEAPAHFVDFWEGAYGALADGTRRGGRSPLR